MQENRYTKQQKPKKKNKTKKKTTTQKQNKTKQIKGIDERDRNMLTQKQNLR